MNHGHNQREYLLLGKGATEDEMVEWHGDASAKLNRHEFKQPLGNSEGSE